MPSFYDEGTILIMNEPSTDFQKKVWEQIDQIPLGQTMTYKQIAIAIGSPRSSRAVAKAYGITLLRIKLKYRLFVCKVCATSQENAQ